MQGRATFEECIRPPTCCALLNRCPASYSEEFSAWHLQGTLSGQSFVNRAKQEFDLVIVDSVPVVAPIADFELLSAPCVRKKIFSDCPSSQDAPASL